MSEPIYLTTLFMFFGTIIVIFAIRYHSATQQARARLAHDDAYRILAQQVAAAQADNARTLLAIQASLVEVGARVATIEQVLKQVD